MRPFSSIDYLCRGSSDQRHAYAVLKRHRIMERLRAFDPLLVGTVPIDVHIQTSDLDIICRVRRLCDFRACLERHFSHFDGFQLRETFIDGRATLIAHCRVQGWPLEIFGQDRATYRQTAYRHLRAEQRLLREHGTWLRLLVIRLKRRGFKTEPAFARALGRKGDPYRSLMRL